MECLRRHGDSGRESEIRNPKPYSLTVKQSTGFHVAHIRPRIEAEGKGDPNMTIGSGIVLFVIGAILVFALNVEVEFINLDLTGYILMGAGVVVALFGLIFMLTRRGRDTTTRIE